MTILIAGYVNFVIPCILYRTAMIRKRDGTLDQGAHSHRNDVTINDDEDDTKITFYNTQTSSEIDAEVNERHPLLHPHNFDSPEVCYCSVYNYFFRSNQTIISDLHADQTKRFIC